MKNIVVFETRFPKRLTTCITLAAELKKLNNSYHTCPKLQKKALYHCHAIKSLFHIIHYCSYSLLIVCFSSHHLVRMSSSQQDSRHNTDSPLSELSSGRSHSTVTSCKPSIQQQQQHQQPTPSPLPSHTCGRGGSRLRAANNGAQQHRERSRSRRSSMQGMFIQLGCRRLKYLFYWAPEYIYRDYETENINKIEISLIWLRYCFVFNKLSVQIHWPPCQVMPCLVFCPTCMWRHQRHHRRQKRLRHIITSIIPGDTVEHMWKIVRLYNSFKLQCISIITFSFQKNLILDNGAGSAASSSNDNRIQQGNFSVRF